MYRILMYWILTTFCMYWILTTFCMYRILMFWILTKLFVYTKTDQSRHTSHCTHWPYKVVILLLFTYHIVDILAVSCKLHHRDDGEWGPGKYPHDDDDQQLVGQGLLRLKVWRDQWVNVFFNVLQQFFLNGPSSATFSFIFVFQVKHYNFYNKYMCEKMSIQYKVLGFEPTTFRTWVSSHNH